jgi:serine protease AprX
MKCGLSFLCGLILLLSNTASAQTQYAYRISFIDKNGSPDLTNPLLFLSQRSLDRRTAQGIALAESDRPVSPVYINNVLNLTGGKFHLASRWLNYLVILVDDQAQIAAIQAEPYISSIKYISYFQNGLHKMSGGGKNTDKLEEWEAKSQNKTTGGTAYYGSTFEQTQLVQGDYLHDHGYKGEGKLITVLDAGFKYVNTNTAFSDLIQSGRLIDKRNFVLANDDVFNGDSHGTSALSAMAGNIPGGYVGTAPNAEYAIYVTEGTGEREIELDNMVAATERSDSLGADVISVSLGYNYFDAPLAQNSFVFADLDGKTTIVAKAANMATAKGILFVASAGNEGGNSWNNILTPGDADSALTIGSVDINRVVAPNSGFGPNAAGQRKPDVCAVGNPAAVLAGGPNAIYINGTSFAVPQIAGWAACLLQWLSHPTPYRVRQAIIESAHLYSNPNDHAGYGVPNFYTAAELLNVDDITPSPSATNWVYVYPNPFINELKLDIYQPANGEVSIMITDVTGREVYSSHSELSKGTHYLSIPTSALYAGTYFIKTVSGGRTNTQKLVK